jgi:hypothetical protein
MSLLARWRVDQLVYEDTSGTDAVEDADAVASWGISAGSVTGLAVQSTSGRRPVYAANDGGYPSLTFSNTNKSSLLLAHSASWVTSALSWLAVVKHANTNSSVPRHFWGRSAMWTEAAAWYTSHNATGSATPPSDIYAHSGYQTRGISMPRQSSGWFVIAGTIDATELRMYGNRQSAVRIAQSGTLSMGTSSLAIGADADNTAYSLDGSYRELAFWNTALSESEMATEIDAAMARWNVTNTVTPPASGNARLINGGLVRGQVI